MLVMTVRSHLGCGMAESFPSPRFSQGSGTLERGRAIVKEDGGMAVAENENLGECPNTGWSLMSKLGVLPRAQLWGMSRVRTWWPVLSDHVKQPHCLLLTGSWDKKKQGFFQSNNWFGSII